MINILHIKNDFKQIFRSPIMVIFFILPLFMPVLFKALLIFLVPFIKQFIEFDIAPYYEYILSGVIVEAPLILGIVTGFMMLDEKDGKIFRLMCITPLGSIGYLINRMTFSFVASFVCTFITYYVLNIFALPFLTLIFIALLMSILSIIIAFILSLIATDKVKGMTYAKALNFFSLFILADLLQLPWVSALSHIVPTYWITKIIFAPYNFINIILAFGVSFIWLWSMYLVYKRREE